MMAGETPYAAQSWWDLAELLHRRRDIQAAAAAAARARAAGETTARNWTLLAEIQRDLGNSQEALACLNRALELEPRSAWAWALKGLLSSGQPEALEHLDRARALDPGRAEIAAWRCRERRRRGDIPGAAEDRAAVSRSAPGAAYHLCAWSLDKPQSLRGAHPDLAALEERLRLNPDEAWSHAWAGEILLRLGRAREAARRLDAAVDLGAGPWALAWRGEARLKAGEPGALADLDEAVRRSPDLWPFRAWKAEALAAAGLRLKAYFAMDEYVAASGGSAAAVAWRGELKLKCGDLEGALADLDGALSRDPGVAWARGWRGQVFWLQGDAAAAAREWDAALERDPADLQSLFWRARARYESGDFEGGDRDREQARRLDARRKEVRALSKCRCEALVGDRRLYAAQDLDEVLGVLPRLLREHSFREGPGPDPSQHQEALEELDAYLHEEPGDADAWALRGRLLHLRGEKEQAHAAFEQAVSRDALCARALLWRAALAPGRDWEDAGGDPFKSGFFAAAKQEPRTRRALLFLALECVRRGPPGGDAQRWAALFLDGVLRREPRLVPARLLRARLRADSGRPEAAAEDLRIALDTDPCCAAVGCLLARIQAGRGERGGAVVAIESAMRVDPDSKFAFNLLLDAGGDVPNDETGLEKARWLLEREPGAYWAWALSAEIKRLPEFCRYAEAVDDLERASEAAPAAAWVRAFLGRARANFNDPAGGIAELDRAVAADPECGWLRAWRGEARRKSGDLARAVSDLDEALRLDPGYDLSWLWRGIARSQTGDDEGALEDLSRAAAMDPYNAAAFFERSQCLRRLRRYAGAFRDLRYAAALDPKFSWWNSRQRPEQGDRLLNELDEAVRGDPDSAWARAWRGHTLLQMGRLQEAARDLDAALGLDPDLAWVLTWRGETWAKLERYPEALRDLEKAVLLEPGYAPAHAWSGVVRYRSGDEPEAEACLSKAVALDPKSAWAWAWRGEVRVRLGRFAEAVSDLDRALVMDRRNGDYYFWRAEARRALGQASQARADLDQALALNPGHLLAWVSRAVCRGALGDLDGQRDDFGQALRLDPGFFQEHSDALRALGVTAVPGAS